MDGRDEGPPPPDDEGERRDGGPRDSFVRREGETGMRDLFEWQTQKWQLGGGRDNAIRQRVKRGHGCKVNEKNGHEKRQEVFGGLRDIKDVMVDSLS